MISRVQSLRVEKKDNQEQKNNEEKDKKKKKSQQDTIPEEDLNNVSEIIDDLEIGRLVMKKRSAEILLMAIDSNDSAIRTIELNAESELLNSEKDILEYKEKNYKPDMNESDINEQLLDRLSERYDEYFFLVNKESDMISDEQFDSLPQIYKEKEEIIKDIETIQTRIRFEHYTSLPENSEKRTKANMILSDIHSRINKIINTENENSVKLQVGKQRLSTEIKKINTGSEMISKYASSVSKSHFINTKK